MRWALADAARLLKRRGLAMQRAVPVGVGAMAALLGVELEAARDIAEEAAQGEVCDLANDNGGGQVVVSGHKTRGRARGRDCRRARRAALDHAAGERALPLRADGSRPPTRWPRRLPRSKLGEPWVPLIANVSAAPVRDPDEIKRLLVEQVTGLVRWRECVLAMKAAGRRRARSSSAPARC